MCQEKLHFFWFCFSHFFPCSQKILVLSLIQWNVQWKSTRSAPLLVQTCRGSVRYLDSKTEEMSPLKRTFTVSFYKLFDETKNNGCYGCMAVTWWHLKFCFTWPFVINYWTCGRRWEAGRCRLSFGLDPGVSSQTSEDYQGSDNFPCILSSKQLLPAALRTDPLTHMQTHLSFTELPVAYLYCSPWAFCLPVTGFLILFFFFRKIKLG